MRSAIERGDTDTESGARSARCRDSTDPSRPDSTRPPPVARARRLYQEAPGPKEYLEIPNGHHADLARLGLIDAMESFISRVVAPPP